MRALLLKTVRETYEGARIVMRWIQIISFQTNFSPLTMDFSFIYSFTHSLIYVFTHSFLHFIFNSLFHLLDQLNAFLCGRTFWLDQNLAAHTVEADLGVQSAPPLPLTLECLGTMQNA